MSRLTEFIIDTWSGLDYKFDTPTSQHRSLQPPRWVGEHERRVQAYMVIDAYLHNRASQYLQDATDEDKRNRHEYGDPMFLVETIVACLLGDEVTVWVDDEADREWAETWSRQEAVIRKVFSLENKSVGLGDAVALISWDAYKDRPAIEIYHPSFYFPDLDDMIGDFPGTICLAWEYEETDREGKVDRFVRRIKYKLEDLEEPRDYPWNDEPSWLTCLVWDGVWKLPDINGTDVLDLSDSKATWAVNADGEEMNGLDLDRDFISAVHLPNTDDDEHFGMSSLMNLLQIFDDLQAADSDLEASAGIVGFPPMASEGMIEGSEDGEIKSYGPGTVFSGKISAIDTSRSLDALTKYVDFLVKRLLTIARVPDAVVGRIKPSEVSSGIELRLHFTPLERLMYKMRLIRVEKYPLIYKFARRLAMQAGQIPASTSEAEITLVPGSFLPAELESTVIYVAQGVTQGVISLETAVKMLVRVGMPVDSAKEEVDAIRRHDFRNAALLSQALGDPKAVYEYLGIEIPEHVQQQFDQPPPEPELPGGPPTPPE